MKQSKKKWTKGLPFLFRWHRIRAQYGRPGFNPWAGKIPWRRARQPTPGFLPGESPGSEEAGGLQSMSCKKSEQLNTAQYLKQPIQWTECMKQFFKRFWKATKENAPEWRKTNKDSSDIVPTHFLGKISKIWCRE